MSGYDSANEFVRPRRRHPRNVSQDDGVSSDPYEYQQESPSRHYRKRRGHKRSVRRHPSRRQQAAAAAAWQADHEDMDDEDDAFGYPFLPFPFPPPLPHRVGHDGFYGPEEFDPYEEEAMLHLDEMGRLPPPPLPPFARFGPMMPPPPPPFHPFNMIPPPDEYFLEDDVNDDQEAISDDDYNNRPMAPAPPFMDEHVPPPGFLPPLPRLGPLPPPIPFVDQNMARLKRSRSLPTRKSRIPATSSELLHRNNSNSSRLHRKRHPSLHRTNSVSSSPGARRSTQQHEPLAHERPHAFSAPGSPVELYSPTMEDQFHDALSHQEEDQQSSPLRHSMPRRRSIHVLPSMTPHPPPPPIPMLGRRHSVYDSIGNNDMFSPQPLHHPPPMAAPPLAAMGLRHDMGDEVPSNNSSAPGTPWMPASYFSSPAMPPAPHTQPPPMMPPPSATQGGMGMLPSTFGPPMNPFMMARPPPPMPMMSMMGGNNGIPGMLEDEGFPPFGGGGNMNPMFGGGNPMMNDNMMMGQGAFGNASMHPNGSGPMDSMQHGNQRMNDRDMNGNNDFDMGGGPPSGSRANSSMGNHHHHHHAETGGHHPGNNHMPPSSMMGNNSSGGAMMSPHSQQHMMMMGGGGGGGRPPMRRKSWLGGLFGGGGEGSKAVMMDRHMWDRNNMVPLEDALGHMSIHGHGESPSSMRSFGSGLSRKSSNRISNKAQQLQRFPGIWCYRPRNMIMHQGGDEEGGGGNVWAPFSVSNQRKLHRLIDMGSGHLPSSSINLDREEKLSGTIQLIPRNMIAYHFRSLLSGRPEILDVQYIPTHDSQFVVRPEHDMAAGGGPPAGSGAGMASKLIGSMFGS